MPDPKVDAALEVWLQVAIPKHSALTNAVALMIRGFLDRKKIDYLSVEGRTKTAAGIREKIERKAYSDPKSQLTDISGIRVITFFKSQVDEVCKVIEAEFNVDTKNSLDKSSLLGVDRLGYRSVHYVCDLGSKRMGMTEYSDYDGLKFELQVRTVLQHAWAELAHDRNYKFSEELPQGMQRQLFLYAGMLEIADSGFDTLVQGIDAYVAKIGRLDVKTLKQQEELNALSLQKFLQSKADSMNVKISGVGTNLDLSVQELRDYGASSLEDVDKLFTAELVAAHKKHIGSNTMTGLARVAMLYADLEGYFERAWKERWRQIKGNIVDMLGKKYTDQTVTEVLDKHRISHSKKAST